ncbi:MAG: tetratricopeptide repeat protein [Prevotella sp.]|nr:tetratricopeptide repeat protein [Prevotella sp.]
MTANDFYLKGNEYRQQGNWQEALNHYIAAIELDPSSPAVQAKEMVDDIMNYYCKDIYNP